MDDRARTGPAAAGTQLGPLAAAILRAAAGDVIVARATPPGRGAIAVLRVSGALAGSVAGAVIAPWPIPPRRPTLCAIRDAGGGLLDRALVTWFEAPRSYTGEPLVEISTHGGATVPAEVMAALVAAGAREAQAGEFTRRAVANGKLDLVQAEAIADLVDARSPAMRRAALAQLDGGLSAQVSALREALLEVETLLAYDIDFPEEDDGPVPRERISAAVAAARERLDALLRTATAGELVRDGAVAVIAGPPNVGKSSLFNALVGRARALVTEIPGTTRDALEAVIDAGDWPVRLIDTAGLRASDDVVERLGIEVAERHIASAQLVLACGDGRQALADAVRRARALTDRPIIAVRTKADLANGGGESRSVADVPDGAVEEVDVSAQTRAGLPALLNAISRRLTGDFGALSPDAPVVTRARHRLALGRARAELVAFEEAWREGVLPATVAAVPLRSAVAALEELIGAVGPEDVLDRLFRTFCVGK